MSGDWDHVVVGAGTAGCVLASRLAAAGRRVLLVEAGEDHPPPPALRDAAGPVLRGYNWDVWARVRGTRAVHRARGAGGLSSRYPYFLGKVVGGSSAVNGTIALRARAADFDEWAALGNDEWAGDRVIPLFRGIEAEHGGPVAITRPDVERTGPVELAFHQACVAAGLPALEDLNDSTGPGVGAVPVNAVAGERVSTATAYLDPVRDRLRVLTGRTVHRVLFRGTSAVGVEMIRDGVREAVHGKRITICAGAIGTPGVLFRSGLGDADACRSAGVEPVADLPGVGRNLVDHPAVVLWAVPKPGSCVAGRPWHQVMARVTSVRAADPDLAVFLLHNVVTSRLPVLGEALGTPLATGLSVVLLKPRSRGRVVLGGTPADTEPAVELELGSDPDDLDRLVDGVRTAWSLLRSAGLARHVERTLLWHQGIIDDDVLLKAAVANFVSPSLHPAGTARMGPATDPMAVVDQYCRVHRVSNLRVVDASVMPTMPSAPPNLTCMVLAERVASWMGASEGTSG